MMQSNQPGDERSGRSASLSRATIGIQGKLLLLLLSVTLPVLFIYGLITYDRLQGRRASELQANLEVARAVARNFETFVQDILHQELTLGLIFSSPAPLPDAREILKRSRADHPAVRDYAWVDSHGQVVDSSNPEALGLDVAERDYFRDILAGKEWSVSPLFLSRLDGQPIFTISHGLRDDAGSLLGVMVASILPERLDDVLAIRRDDAAGICLIDSQGRFVFGFPALPMSWEERDWSGRYDTIRQALAGREAMGLTVTHFDGQERFLASTPIPAIGWVANAGRRQEEAMYAVRSALAWHGLYFLLVLGAASVSAWLISRGIVRPIRRLQEHVASLGSTEPDAPFHGPAELQELAATFDAMAREVRETLASANETKAHLAAELESRKGLLDELQRARDAAESARAEAERRALVLDATINAIADGVMVFDADRNLLRTNAMAEFLLGSTTDKRRFAFHEDEDALAIRSLDGHHLAREEMPVVRAFQGQTTVGQILWITPRPDGKDKCISFSAAPIRSLDGRFLGVVSTFTDVTRQLELTGELREAHDELELRVAERTAELIDANEVLYRREREFKALVENSPDLVIRFDRLLHPLYVNPAITAALGLEPEAVIGREISGLGFGEANVALWHEKLQVVFHTGRELTVETVFPGADGHCRTFEVRIVPEFARDNSVEHVLAIGRDVTKREAAEKSLKDYMQRLERSNRALQEFASIASHDLQEPLRKVSAFGRLLQDKHGEAFDAEGRDFLDRMLKATGRMHDLINSLLDYSRVATRAEPSIPVNLNQVIQEVLTDLELRIEQTGGRVEVGELPVVLADPSQVRQLFQNLIGNALKFHRDEKPVVKVYATVDPVGRSCALFVEDNGIGFDERYLDRIFAPFQRLHGRSAFEGTGMGLAICKRIVERHGGTITARSTTGQGSTFIIQLPMNH